MLLVEIGNASAIEAIRGDDGQIQFQDLPGEHTTSIQLPDGMNLREQMETIASVVEYHLAPGARPSWIECSDETLRTTMCQHWGIPKTKRRTATWGARDRVTPVYADGAPISTSKTRKSRTKKEPS